MNHIVAFCLYFGGVGYDLPPIELEKVTPEHFVATMPDEYKGIEPDWIIIRPCEGEEE